MKNSSTKCLALYGIQDVDRKCTPSFSHDHSAALFQEGKIEKFIQLERYTRHKYDNRLQTYLYNLLKSERITKLASIDLVFTDNILGRSFTSEKGDIRFEAPIRESLHNGIEEGRARWLGKPQKAYILNHELAHIGSCLPFYGSFKENSLLIHFDGGASLSNFSAWQYKNNNITHIESSFELNWLTELYNSNALVFSIINANRNNQQSVPGKLMGYAPFGLYSVEMENWLRENNWFSDVWGNKQAFFDQVKKKWNLNISTFNQKESIFQNITATIQEIFIRETIAKIKSINKSRKYEYLYFSGGCALSIKLNSVLNSLNIFKEIFIPPCPNDSGIALGAGAFFQWFQGYNLNSSSPYINNWNIDNYTVQYSKKDIKSIAHLILEGKTIGICNGFGECGPRALGNRSIIALPTKNLSQKVSINIKKREWYRPVAPIMLEKNAKEIFGLDSIPNLCKYMLLDLKIKNYYKNIAGIIHVDNTSRPQVLFNREQNPFMWDLLMYLNDCYSVKALINTSFNMTGEPIVHTTEDAIRTAKLSGLDAVVINGKLIS